MRDQQKTIKFKRDVRLAKRRGKDMTKLTSVMSDLIDEIPLRPALKDHPLKGEFDGCRECHLEPNWLLIYALNEKPKTVTFILTGTHADLFK